MALGRREQERKWRRQYILKEAEKYSSEKYSVIIKWRKINNEGKRNYDRCLGVPFLVYTSGDAKVFPCGMFFDYRKDEFVMGDLLERDLMKF